MLSFEGERVRAECLERLCREFSTDRGVVQQEDLLVGTILAVSDVEEGHTSEAMRGRGSSLQRKEQGLDLWLPNARLFLDDIEAIYDLLSELGRVEIETNLYKLESLDAFKELPPDQEVVDV